MANGFQEEIKAKVDIKCFIVCLIGKKKEKKNLSSKTSFFFSIRSKYERMSKYVV